MANTLPQAFIANFRSGPAMVQADNSGFFSTESHFTIHCWPVYYRLGVDS